MKADDTSSSLSTRFASRDDVTFASPARPRTLIVVFAVSAARSQDAFNSFARSVGLNTDEYSFTDIFSLDAELLAFTPQPTLAVVMLFPTTLANRPGAPKVAAADAVAFYTKQTDELGNACGTIAALHSMANNMQRLGIAADSVLGKLVAASAAAGSNPEATAKLLERDEDVKKKHNDTATSSLNQTAVVDDDKVCYHFVAYVRGRDNALIELDGRRAEGALEVGRIADDSGSALLNAAADAIKTRYMAPNPTELGFAMMALAKTSA